MALNYTARRLSRCTRLMIDFLPLLATAMIQGCPSSPPPLALLQFKVRMQRGPSISSCPPAMSTIQMAHSDVTERPSLRRAWPGGPRCHIQTARESALVGEVEPDIVADSVRRF